MNKEELIKKIEEIDISYDYEDTYYNLYNTCIEYMNESQDFNLDYLFEDFYSYDVVEEIAKNELENGGLIRLYYFLGNADLNNTLFRINAYGNLEDIEYEDLEYLKSEILEQLKGE